MDLKEKRDYCLNCMGAPCKKLGCPLQNDIPDFIHEEDDEKAFEILSKTTVLSPICGRVCPHTKQCQGICTRNFSGESVSIGEIEAYIGDKAIEKGFNYKKVDSINKNVAVVGSGPSGLTCAAFLAMKGVQVTIYEKNEKLGGLLNYGIPDFRLDRRIVENTIQKILDLGIEVKCNSELGKDFSLNELTKKYNSVYLAIGANEPNYSLKGQNVLSANKLLEDINKNIEIPNFKNKKVVVSGGGNVAMDAARTLKRLGAKVTVIYRRDFEQMPAELKEIEIAKEEKIEFLVKTNILNVLSDNKIKCIKTELVNKKDSNRLVPVNIENSEFEYDADFVVLATGSKTNEKLLREQGLELNEYGYTKVNDKMQTSIKNVFAGGDLVGTKATVAWSARNGRDAAEYIFENITKI